jgi:putative tricarboxylic transport membrane protein
MRNQKPEGESIWSGIQFRKLIIVVASLLGYWLFLEKIGFILTTFLLLLILFKTVDAQRWRSVFTASVLTVVAIYIIFVIVLRVELPSGLWRIG